MKIEAYGYVGLLLAVFGWRDGIDIPGLKEGLDEVLSALSPIERKVLDMSFGLTSGSMLTYEEIANELKITRKQVDEHITIALRKLRHPSRSRGLNPFIDAITLGRYIRKPQPPDLERGE